MDWLKKANEAIKEDAEYAYNMCYIMCEDTALHEKLELGYVLDKFRECFNRLWKKQEAGDE